MSKAETPQTFCLKPRPPPIYSGSMLHKLNASHAKLTGRILYPTITIAKRAPSLSFTSLTSPGRSRNEPRSDAASAQASELLRDLGEYQLSRSHRCGIIMPKERREAGEREQEGKIASQDENDTTTARQIVERSASPIQNNKMRRRLPSECTTKCSTLWQNSETSHRLNAARAAGCA